MSSCGLADWYVSGQELTSASAPVSAVINSSSVMSAFPSTALSDLLADFIIDSCTPPKCGASGGVKCQTIPLFDVDALILSSSNCWSNALSSLSAALKCVALSDTFLQEVLCD